MKSKRVALYIRVSTEEQARQGLSLDAQLTDLRSYADKHKYNIVGVYTDDGASARKKPFSRRAFKQLIEDIKQNKIDRVLFIKLDRWFRSVKDYYKAQEILDMYKVDWETTQEDYNTTTTNGRLMLNIKLSIAQNESDMTSDRINFVFAQKRARHEICSGKIPFGYSVQNKKLVPNENAKYVQPLFEHFVKTQNLTEAARWMCSHGFYYTYASISHVLKNERYIGRSRGDDEFCKPIVTEEIFYKAQKIIRSKKLIKRTPTGRAFLFTSLIRCPVCGHPYNGVGCVGKRNGKTYYYYRCPHGSSPFKACTNHKRLKEYVIEEALLNSFDEAYKNFRHSVNQKQKTALVTSDVDKMKRKLNRLKELFLNELIDLDEYKKIREELTTAIAEAEKPKIQASAQFNYYLPDGIRPYYEKMTREQRRQFWHQTVDRIDIDEDDMPRITFIS